MSMSAPSSSDSAEPMMEMNTTPLIDVLLVLLIMFIITLPPPTHAVKVDLPMDCKTQPGGCPDKPPVEPDKNVLYILPGGQIMWNTTQVGLAELQELLIQSTEMEKEPELHFTPDPEAQYDMVNRVLKAVKVAKVNKLGFVGNENYRNF
jgi:biopolymer transport protein ExbD